MSTTHISEPTESNAKSKDGPLLETISLRDFFAAKAMQGLIAQSMGTALGSDPKVAAEYAYATADAMLKVREK